VDLAQAHILALTREEGGAFNLGNGIGYSVREVIETARAVTGRPIREKIAPRRPGDPPRLVASTRRAREQLGWNPRFEDLATIIESAWQWHRAHPQGYGR
jgi:UDP-glucose 4-epimerase